MSLGCGDSSMVVLDLEAGWSESLLQLENSMMLSKKHYGQDAGKHIEGRNEYQIADL